MDPVAISPRKDLERRVFCILGLPFDTMDLEATVEHLLDCICARQRCLLATPNVNFLVTAWRDEAFRKAVLASDLLVPDGMPIIWIARWLGLPLRKRVAGSDLVETLASRQTFNPIRCFFFGGEDDAAEAACRAVTANSHGLTGSGALNPGHGDVTELSSHEIIEAVNTVDSDFLVVALGARKGQLWLVENGPVLKAPVISHLGAVVNFHAGRIRRAPRWMQRCGLEWLWRIGQEPALLPRYLGDGLCLAWMLLSQVLPLAFTRPPAKTQTAGTIEWMTSPSDERVLQLAGSFTDESMTSLRSACAEAVESGGNVTIDLSAVEHVDAAFAGTMLILEKHCLARKRSLILQSTPPSVYRALKRMGVERLTTP